MALLVSCGNLGGGLVGPNVFIAAQAPKYPTGFGVCLAMVTIAIIMSIVLRFVYDAENKRRRRLLDSDGVEAFRSRYTEQEMLDLGDRNPFFVYTL